MENLNVSEICISVSKLTDNARELLEEAELLFNNRHFARAFTLAHLASEEIAKIPSLIEAAIDLSKGKIPNWEDADLRKHPQKIKRGLNMEIIQAFYTSAGKIDVEKLKEAEQIAIDLNNLKNDSLYVNVSKGKKPSEVISQETATNAIQETRRRLQQLQEIEFGNATQTEQKVIKFSNTDTDIDAHKYIKFLTLLSRERDVNNLISLAKSGALGPDAYEQLVNSGLLDKITSVTIVPGIEE